VQADDEPAADVVAANLRRSLVHVRVDGTAVEGDLTAAVGPLDRGERSPDACHARRNGYAGTNEERRPELRALALAVDLEVVLGRPVVERLLRPCRQDRPELVVDVADRRRAAGGGRGPDGGGRERENDKRKFFMDAQSCDAQIRYRYSIPVYVSSFSRWCRASMRRTVPERDRMTIESVIAPFAR